MCAARVVVSSQYVGTQIVNDNDQKVKPQATAASKIIFVIVFSLRCECVFRMAYAILCANERILTFARLDILQRKDKALTASILSHQSFDCPLAPHMLHDCVAEKSCSQLCACHCLVSLCCFLVCHALSIYIISTFVNPYLEEKLKKQKKKGSYLFRSDTPCGGRKAGVVQTQFKQIFLYVLANCL